MARVDFSSLIAGDVLVTRIFVFVFLDDFALFGGWTVFLLFWRMMHFYVMVQVLLIFEAPIAILTRKRVAILVPFLVFDPQLDRVQHDVAKGAAIFLPLRRVEMRHSMLCQLLLIFKWTSANVALRLQRVVLVMSDTLVFHPTSIGGKSEAALPSANVGLEAGMAVHVTLHVSLDVELFPANLAGVAHVSGVLPLVLFQMVFFPISFVTAGKLALESLAILFLVSLILGLPSLSSMPSQVFPEHVGLGKSLETVLMLAHERLLGAMDNPEMAKEVVNPGEGEIGASLGTLKLLLLDIVLLDVPEDERRLDILQAFGTFGIYSLLFNGHAVKLEYFDFLVVCILIFIVV